MKKRHCEADGFENSKVGPRDGTPDPPKKLSLVLPMSFPLQTVHITQAVLVLRYIQTFERKTTNATVHHMSRNKTIRPEILPKIIFKKKY